MRINHVRDLGMYVREQRRHRGLTQAGLADSAQVSRRWLSDLEAGKPTAEVGLVFRVLHELDLAIEVSSAKPGPGSIDLDEVMEPYLRRAREAGHG